MTQPSQYVTNHAWVRTLARPDGIDELADQFERPVAAPESARQWPQRSRGWRSLGILHPHAVREAV